MMSSLSKGVFFSVSVLFFTRFAGFSARTVGLGLTAAGCVAVAAALAAGYLARAVGARPVLILTTVGQGIALLAYLAVRTPEAFVIVASAAVGQQAMQRTALTTMIAEAFVGPDRVQVRARLRVITNIFIAAGTALASLALTVDTTSAYQAAMAAAGLLTLISAYPLVRTGVSADANTHQLRTADNRLATRRRSPLRDPTYLTVTGLYSLIAMQFGLLTIGVPLWIAGQTRAPAVSVAVLLALNTVLVSVLQVWAARRAADLRTAGRSIAHAGVLLTAACALYAMAARGTFLAVLVVLALATVAHSLAEILSEAGSWTLSFELADPANAGAYQGVSQAGPALGAMLAPLVVTATAIEHGVAGWAALAAIFLTAALATYALVRRHESRTAGDQRAATGNARAAPTASARQTSASSDSQPAMSIARGIERYS
jgi:hypothetical protein